MCDIAPDVPEMIQGDSTRLRQVILNLVGNAIKFTAAGEVGVRVEMEGGEDDIGNVHFTVTDTGIGIAPDKRDAIFKPFIAGRYINHTQLRRDRFGIDHLCASGIDDGRKSLVRERGGMREPISLPCADEGSARAERSRGSPFLPANCAA